MTFRHIARTAFTGLATHRSRTGLTVLGVIIGTAAIVLVSSIGTGAQGLILSQVAGLGPHTIAVIPGREPTGPADPSIAETLYGDSLKDRELEALQKKTNVPALRDIMPLVFGIETTARRGETFRPMIIGATPLISDLFDLYPESGTLFTADDVRSNNTVAVIGTRVRDELFGGSDPIGETIRIKNKNYRVIGVFPKKGQVLFFNLDETVLMPYTVAQQYVLGIKHFNRLVIRVSSEDEIPAAVADITATLRDLHGITDPDRDDFFVATQKEVEATLTAVTNAMTLLLAALAAIALLVGGVGIMNIMLVAVAERTREIGLRKAVGATPRSILMQFLLESTTMTATGGLAGISLGGIGAFAISWAIREFANPKWNFIFPYFAACLGLLVAVGVGLIFGLYPAYRASRLNPIEALSHE